MIDLLTTDEVAAILKLNVQTVRRWLREGKLKGIKIADDEWRMHLADLQEFIKVKP